MPGVAYALARERHRPSRRLSAFRETAVAVLVSSIWAVAAVSVLYLSQLLTGATHSLLVNAITDPTKFIADDVELEVGVLLGYLVVATSLSWIFGTALFRRFLRFVTKSEAFDPTSSAWWVLFEQHLNDDKIVSITLEDGTWVSGTLFSWSRDSDDGPDRELTIREPLRFRAPNAKKTSVIEGQAAMSISARRIMYLSVQYREKQLDVQEDIQSVTTDARKVRRSNGERVE